MVRLLLLMLIGLSCQVTTKAQDTSYAALNMPVLLKHPNINKESVRLMYRRNMQFLFDAYAGYLKERKSNKEKTEAAERLSLLKKNFDEREKFPDSIMPGWHNIILTDNNEFCKLAKVLVSNNSVVQLAIEGCIRMRCTSAAPIKNARCVITLPDINNSNEPFDVYFSSDLDQPSLIEEPTQPGYVFFWTSTASFLHERLLIDGIRRDMMSGLYDEAPNCLETGVPFYIMTPGVHHLRATKTGNDREASFEIKPGMCLSYRIK